MAADPVVGGDCDSAVSSRHRLPRLGRDERLIGEGDHGTAGGKLGGAGETDLERCRRTVAATVG